MLFQPASQDFKWSYSNVSATRPAAAFGTSVTPAVLPTKGSWVQVISAANMANDGWGIMVNINSSSTSSATRQQIVDVGVDNAGGTSYLVKIPDLICGHAAPYNVGSGGVWYYFPIFIKAGSTVAVRASGTTTGAIRAYITVYGLPRRPENVRVGHEVYSFGVNATTGQGTAITLGTTAEGAWTQIGAALSEAAPFFWQVGYTCVDTSMTAAVIHFDVGAGDASFKKLLVENNLITISSSEQIGNLPTTAGCVGNTAIGDLIYIRGQSSATPDTSTTVAVYGCA